ncbi:MAG: PilZ domain-containing protein [Gammaproteobacteria bacterium]|nr:PilZ domain-containing protein [Gammaproteobacteria bacterium]MBQ0839520.1 PilZ domain-containing protein [Gammaproteobacteria bacterium]
MENNDSFFQGLYYESNISLVWQLVDALPGDNELVKINEDNSRFLKALAALNEGAPEAGEELPQTAAELQRLDLKLNLLLEFVGQLLASQRSLPPPTRVRLGHAAIEWLAEDCPPPGAQICIEVYLRSELPAPLKFHGIAVLAGSEPGSDGASKRVQLRFVGLNATLQDDLEKFIFRRHRRSIAQRQV